MSINHALEVVRNVSSVEAENHMFGEKGVLTVYARSAIIEAISLRQLHGNPEGLYRIIVQFVLPDGAE